MEGQPPARLDPTRLLTEVYGPYAFGLSAVMLIWLTIVAPELRARSINWETQQQVVLDMKQLASEHAQIVTVLESSVKMLGVVVDKLDKISERDKHSDNMQRLKE